MVTIVITPKLGPYGSGMISAGFDIEVTIPAEYREMSPAEWDKYRIRLNKELTIEFDRNGNPHLVQIGSEK